jgi:hypothetical protein
MFRTQHDVQVIDYREDKFVKATGPVGEVFTVTVSTIPNSTTDIKRITVPLYQVGQLDGMQ